MTKMVLLAVLYGTGPQPGTVNSDCAWDGAPINGKQPWVCHVYETPGMTNDEVLAEIAKYGQVVRQ